MYIKNIGILVDAENLLNPSLLIPIIRAAHAAGHLSALVLFGNWDSPSLAPWKHGDIKLQLEGWGAVWSTVPKTRPGKNASDIALTFEAACMAHERHVTEIWLISGDSDFTPMINRLQDNGIRVVVFGPKTSTRSLRDSCASFVLLDDVQQGAWTPLPSQPQTPRPPFPARQLNANARQVISNLVADKRGWFHGFVRTVGRSFGFIQVNPVDTLFFGAHHVDQPMTIQDLHSGDAVEFKLDRNHQGFVACHVRKTFAFRAA